MIINKFSLIGLIASLSLAVGCDNNSTSKQEQQYQKTEAINQVPPIDFTLTNHNGEKVDIKSLRGTPLFVDFFYTRCPDPKMCRLTVERTVALQNEVERKFPGKVHFVYISMDGGYDSPDILKQYADKKGINLQRSDLLTGNEELVKEIALNQFYFSFERQSEKKIGHQMISYLVNKEGIVEEFFRWGKWSHDDIMRRIEGMI